MQVTDSWQTSLYYAAFSNVFGVAPQEFVLQRIETGEARSIESSTLDITSKDLIERPLMQTLEGITVCQKSRWDRWITYFFDSVKIGQRPIKQKASGGKNSGKMKGERKPGGNALCVMGGRSECCDGGARPVFRPTYFFDDL
jgi:hypothetical protein